MLATALKELGSRISSSDTLIDPALTENPLTPLEPSTLAVSLTWQAVAAIVAHPEYAAAFPDDGGAADADTLRQRQQAFHTWWTRVLLWAMATASAAEELGVREHFKRLVAVSPECKHACRLLMAARPLELDPAAPIPPLLSPGYVLGFAANPDATEAEVFAATLASVAAHCALVEAVDGVAAMSPAVRVHPPGPTYDLGLCGVALGPDEVVAAIDTVARALDGLGIARPSVAKHNFAHIATAHALSRAQHNEWRRTSGFRGPAVAAIDPDVTGLMQRSVDQIAAHGALRTLPHPMMLTPRRRAKMRADMGTANFDRFGGANAAAALDVPTIQSVTSGVLTLMYPFIEDALLVLAHIYPGAYDPAYQWDPEMLRQRASAATMAGRMDRPPKELLRKHLLDTAGGTELGRDPLKSPFARPGAERAIATGTHKFPFDPAFFLE